MKTQLSYIPSRRASVTIHVAVASLFSSLSLVTAAQVPVANSSVLSDILITATRMPQAAGTILAQTTVISRSDIEAAGFGTLTELLQRKAGVEIRSNGGAGQPAGVFIRGANAQQTLVLIDGQRVGSVTAGGTAFENIPLDLIERIEIVKGAMSGLYGSDAMGGVVQIFTRGSNKPRLSGALGAGSNATLAFDGGFSTVEGKTSFTVNGGYRQTNARSATNVRAGSFAYNPDRDPYSNAHVLAKVSHQLWQGETLSASVWQSVGRVKFDNGGADNGATDDASNKQTLSGAQVASENSFASFWKSNLRFGETRDHIDIKSEYGGTFKTRQQQATWQNQFTTPVGAWVLGFEWLDQRVGGTTEYDKPKRTTQSVFASVNESIDIQRFSANVRRDREQQFGARTTGGISYGIQLAPDELVFVGAGRAFRAPTFNDLYYPGGGNPALRPERSQNVEYGWRVTRPEYRFNLAVFENRFDDLIAYDPLSFSARNIRRARVKGIELTGDRTLFGINWHAAVTAQRPIAGDTQKQLRARAKQFGSLAASKTFGAWETSMDVNASSRRFESDTLAPSPVLAGYAVINANLRYRIDKMWSAELIGTNLANRQYELSRGYNTPGRTVFLNVRAVAY